MEPLTAAHKIFLSTSQYHPVPFCVNILLLNILFPGRALPRVSVYNVVSTVFTFDSNGPRLKGRFYRITFVVACRKWDERCGQVLEKQARPGT